MHLPVQANDGIGFGMQPGYWRTWITGVNWHSSARMTETNPASRNVMTSKSGKMLKLLLLLLLWFLLAVVVCLDVDVWCVKDDDIFSGRCLLYRLCVDSTLVQRDLMTSKCPTAAQSNIADGSQYRSLTCAEGFFFAPSPPSLLHLF